jgi:predicted dehydrogenase
VTANALPDSHGLDDTVSLDLKFPAGSIATIHYFANGAKNLPKERLEIHQSSQTLILNDFRELTVYSAGKRKRHRAFAQDKGQAPMVKQFISRVLEGGTPLIPQQEIVAVSRCCFGALESLRTRMPSEIPS